jgi:hypothetical protein
MKALVTQLYKGGKPLPHGKQPKVFSGELDVSDKMHHVLKGLVTEACLLESDGLLMAVEIRVNLAERFFLA